MQKYTLRHVNVNDATPYLKAAPSAQDIMYHALKEEGMQST